MIAPLLRRLRHAPTLMIAATLAATGGAAAQHDAEPASTPALELRSGDRIVLIGNALAERMQHHGWLETRLQLRFPELRLCVRNLGFAADELTVRQRTQGFGSQDEWLARTRADVIVACFGFNESFGGEAGLAKFEQDLREFVAHVGTLATGRGPDDAATRGAAAPATDGAVAGDPADGHPAAGTGGAAPRLVLVTPPPADPFRHPLLPEPADVDARLAPYADVMRRVAGELGVPLFDAEALRPALTAAADAREPLTLNGVHLTSEGNRAFARAFEQQLFGPPPARVDEDRLEAVRREVLLKNKVWFNRYRATDGYNVYGGRSTLTYDGVTNAEVLQRELQVLDAHAERLDERIHAAARAAPHELPLPPDDSGLFGRGERTDPRAPAPPPATASAPAPTVAPTPPPVDAPPPDAAPIPPQIAVDTNRPGSGPDGEWTYLSPEESLATLDPAPGLAVSLFADEQRFPALVNPVQMSFDTAGRLWVATWPTYPHWQPGQPMDDSLLVLEDTDGDGRADTATPFVDDLHNPTGFEFWGGGVLVANPPDILFLKDVDGDGRVGPEGGDGPDIRERVLHGLSSADTHHSANSFVMGPDGALYFQEGIFHQSQVESVRGPLRNRDGCVWRFDPRTWDVQRHVAYGFLNPHGHVFDRWGQDFITDGTGNDNYYALPIGGYVEPPGKHAGYFRFFDQRSRPAAATEILSSRLFPEAHQGRYLVANVIGFQGVFQYELHDDGSGFSATEVEPLLQGRDPNFRPVDLEVGPDGAVYVADWHNPLIGHMQHHLRDPSRDQRHGRIYRVAPLEPRAPSPPVPITGRPVEELVPLLASPEDRVRYRVRLELSGRNSADVRAAAGDWAAHLREFDDERRGDEHHEHALLEALWLHQQHGVLRNTLARRVLDSPDFRARAAALRVLRQYAARPARWPHSNVDLAFWDKAVNGPLDPLVLDYHVFVAMEDPHPRVRLEAVVACSFVPTAHSAIIALRALKLPTDRFLDYALEETLKTLRPHWRGALVAGEPFIQFNPAGLAHVLARLDDDDLMLVRGSEARDAELLSRHGLPRTVYAEAAAGLAAIHDGSVADELLDAIERADARTDGHADHLLMDLFAVLADLPATASAAPATPMDPATPATPATPAAPTPTEAGDGDTDPRADVIAARLAALARDGRRPATRRLALVARLRHDGGIEPVVAEAVGPPDPDTGLFPEPGAAAVADLFETAPFLAATGDDDPVLATLRAELHGFAWASFGWGGRRAPFWLDDASGGGTRGRYVRVELPGDARTLTLAEVAVFAGGENVAPGSTATQSSTNWGGAAERGIDGITSGAFGDGGQTHTVEDQADPWWELDLGAERDLDRVTIWNRTEGDGRWVSRLDGFTLRVLDAERRTVFEARDQRAPAVHATLELTGSAVARARRAAILALGSLAPDAESAMALLAIFMEDGVLEGLGLPDPSLRIAVLDAVAALDLAALSHWRRSELADWLTARLSPPAADADAAGDAEPSATSTTAGGADPAGVSPAEVRARLALADALLAVGDLEAEGTEGGGPWDGLTEWWRARRELAAVRRRHGPQTFVIRPVPDALLFDRTELAVVAGRPVELTFDNIDIMPHNLLVTAPGALARVGEAGEAMTALPDAWERGFVPDLPEVLHATGLVPPGSRETLAFDAPDEPGRYPFVCTFPGHWVRMNGVLHVVADGEALDASSAAARDHTTAGATAHDTHAGHGAGHDGATDTAGTDTAAPRRAFVANWRVEDLAADVAALAARSTDGADTRVGRATGADATGVSAPSAADDAEHARGRAVLEAASCLRCHRIEAGHEGALTGPPLAEASARHDLASLAIEVLDPSRRIAEGYAGERFTLADGRVVSGRVLSEDADAVHVQTNPYAADTEALSRTDIVKRRTSEVSTMPEALLTTFERDEILDLLRYLDALAPPDG